MYTKNVCLYALAHSRILCCRCFVAADVFFFLFHSIGLFTLTSLFLSICPSQYFCSFYPLFTIATIGYHTIEYELQLQLQRLIWWLPTNMRTDRFRVSNKLYKICSMLSKIQCACIKWQTKKQSITSRKKNYRKKIMWKKTKNRLYRVNGIKKTFSSSNKKKIVQNDCRFYKNER